MLKLLAMLAACLVLLSGCASDPAPESKTVHTGAATQEDRGRETSTSKAPAAGGTSTSAPAPDPDNQAPEATLEASAVTGSAPASITFAINASDADGDALTWNFDADMDGIADVTGDGTELPYSFTFEYTVAGAYNATLTVADPSETVTALVVVEIAAGAPTGAPVVVTGTTYRLAIYCQDSTHPVSGVTGFHYKLEADAVLVAGPAYVVFEIDGALAAAEDPQEGTTPPGVTGVKVCTPTEAQGQMIDYTITFTPQ